MIKTKITTVPFVRQNKPDEQPWLINRELIDGKQIERDASECYPAGVNSRVWITDKNGEKWFDALDYRCQRGNLMREYFAALTPDEIWKRLQEVEPATLRKATAATLYWDLFGGRSAREVSALLDTNKTFAEFVRYATDPTNVKPMKQWVGKMEFAETLMKFGYFREIAEERVEDHNQMGPIHKSIREFTVLNNEIVRAKKARFNAEAEAHKIVLVARAKAKEILKEAKARRDALPRKINKAFNAKETKRTAKKEVAE